MQLNFLLAVYLFFINSSKWAVRIISRQEIEAE